MKTLEPFNFNAIAHVEDNNEKVFALEEAMLDLNAEQVILPVDEFITNGMYARIMHIQKGVAATGSVSKDAHFIALLKGDMSVMTEGGVVRITAPMFNISPAWIKRAGYAHEDSMFLTVHRTDKTNYEDAEEDVFVGVDELYNDWVKKCQALG